jgi:hypothetical protein
MKQKITISEEPENWRYDYGQSLQELANNSIVLVSAKENITKEELAELVEFTLKSLRDKCRMVPSKDLYLYPERRADDESMAFSVHKEELLNSFEFKLRASLGHVNSLVHRIETYIPLNRILKSNGPELRVQIDKVFPDLQHDSEISDYEKENCYGLYYSFRQPYFNLTLWEDLKPDSENHIASFADKPNNVLEKAYTLLKGRKTK